MLIFKHIKQYILPTPLFILFFQQKSLIHYIYTNMVIWNCINFDRNCISPPKKQLFLTLIVIRSVSLVANQHFVMKTKQSKCKTTVKHHNYTTERTNIFLFFSCGEALLTQTTLKPALMWSGGGVLLKEL